MDFQMSSVDMNRTTIQVNEANKKLGAHGAQKSNLGKDSFLKLLVTELSHQDPTKPMEDREFISQMAQFSSLEQMSNMNKEIKSLLKSSESVQAQRMLGKKIEAFNPVTKKKVSGTVSSIQYSGDRIMLMVGNQAVDMKNIHAVYNANENKN